MGGVDLGVVEAERAVWAVIYFIGIVFPDRPGEARGGWRGRVETVEGDDWRLHGRERAGAAGSRVRGGGTRRHEETCTRRRDA